MNGRVYIPVRSRHFFFKKSHSSDWINWRNAKEYSVKKYLFVPRESRCLLSTPLSLTKPRLPFRVIGVWVNPQPEMQRTCPCLVSENRIIGYLVASMGHVLFYFDNKKISDVKLSVAYSIAWAIAGGYVPSNRRSTPPRIHCIPVRKFPQGDSRSLIVWRWN